MNLRGRGEDVERALAVLRRAQIEGRGAMLTVTGDAGVGKSSLVAAVAEQAERIGYAVGLGKAEESDQIAPGAPLLVALRSGSSPLLDGDSFNSLAVLHSQHVWLVDRVASLVEDLSSKQPVLIAIDDVQWADRLSRFALRLLPGRLAGSPVVWLLASRDPDGATTAEAASSARDGVPLHHLQLGPLSDDDVMALATQRLGVAPSGRARTLLQGVGGNAFLVSELLEGLVASREAGELNDEIPDNLRRIVRDRCLAMPTSLQQITKICSVLGVPIQADALSELVSNDSWDLEEDWLRVLLSYGVLVNRGHHIVFRHDLVRQAIYAELTPIARKNLHRRCARWLLQSDSSALTAAPHVRAYASSGDEDAVRILRDAAEECSHFDAEGAAELADDAYRLTATNNPDRAARGLRVVELLTSAHRDISAVARADSILSSVSDAETMARVQLLATRSLWRMGDIAGITERVDAVPVSEVSPIVASRLEAIRALTMTRTEPAQAARRFAGLCLKESRRLGDSLGEQLALEALGEVARNEGRHHDSYQHFHELRSLVGDEYLAVEIRSLQSLDRYEEAAQLLKDAYEQATVAGIAVPPSLLGAAMWQDFNLGEFDEAEAEAQTLIRLADELGDGPEAHDARLILVALLLLRGNVQKARRRLLSVERHLVSDDNVPDPGVILMDGWLSGAEGNLTRAVEILGPLLQDALASRSYWPWWPGWMRVFIELGIAAGDSDFARQAVEVAQVGADRNPGVKSFAGQALYVRGMLEQDVDALGEAVAVLEDAPRKLLLAPALVDYGTALLAAGHRGPAIKALDRAWQLFDSVGVPGPMATVQKTLQRAGVRRKHWSTPHNRPLSGWEALTEGEFRVAELIGSGHSNRSAADRLRLSPNTVGTHLRSIFMKLEVSSRVQLANALHTPAGAKEMVSRGSTV